MLEPIYKQYDTSSTEYIRAMVSACLEGLGKNLGIDFNVIVENYSANDFKIAVTHSIGKEQLPNASSTLNTDIVQPAGTVSTDGYAINSNYEYAFELMTPEGAKEWCSHCAFYNLKPDMYGAIINSSERGSMCATSIKTRNRKHPIIFTRIACGPDNKWYEYTQTGVKCSADYFKKLLGVV